MFFYVQLNPLDHAILHSFMRMVLEWVRVHLGSSTLFLFDFIGWLDCKWGEGVVFCESLSFFSLVYIMYTLGEF